MQLFIATVLRVALAPVAKALVGALGPVFRSIKSMGLTERSTATVFALVAAKFRGESPVAPGLDTLTADEVADLADGLFEATKALMTEYGITFLTDAQCGTILTAVAARMDEKFPAAPVAA